MLTVGVDGWKKGWVGIVLRNGAFDRAVTAPVISELAGLVDGADSIAIDIPIGLPPIEATSPRSCDEQARSLLKANGAPSGRASSVFSAPPQKLLEQDTYAIANQMSRDERGIGLTSQAYHLGKKILQVQKWLDQEGSAQEVHPELSFLAMNRGEPLAFSKKTWGGMEERKRLLKGEGISLSSLPKDVARIPADDVLDAAAAAWSATRIARGEHEILPRGAASGEPTISY